MYLNLLNSALRSVSVQFQIFLNQINSSLVDSNMLVRCITLSLDRFENQSDAKGEQEAMGWDWRVFSGDNG